MKKPQVTAQQIQKLDYEAIERVGIPSVALMENAGRAVAEHVRSMVPNPTGARVGIICGAGNNGGDGFVAARHLWAAGYDVHVYALADIATLKNDPAVHARVIERLGIPLQIMADEVSVRMNLHEDAVIIDALFGVGLSRDIGGRFARAVQSVNDSGRPVVAVDVPSGLDATTGAVYGVCVNASATVTFSFVKTGLMQKEGPSRAGRVIVADIGIPPQLLDRILE